ncbi:cellulose binding domain-containing protein [Glycomyces sp. NEAU-S30]|uniref:non-reducing end alpha-L-arabinofuranosidase n=1 Tax=Glycomyces niveus TaxID=2820287 RepID=A0ABS3TZV7_9ACTN|nr:non-reducing end alpha-L-arabinofuranosidase family hydrolase [Glycomyces sp. NEAU-S30]MBO3732057.1 cellulose binding domain-containing protein [Glycomyces sp. NEAU-S30]
MKHSIRTRLRVVRAALLAAAMAATMAAGLTAHAQQAEEDAAAPAQAAALPTSFTWTSSGVLAGPKPDAAHPNIAGLKDPSVVFHNGKWHVFASIASNAGYNMVYLNFTDWSQAASATHHYLDRSAIGTGYRAAPEVFYYEPQGLWYLVYQTGNASYSTNADISNPNGWSAPKHFYSGMPQIIKDNIGSGYWVDMWVTCDDVNCHLFSSDDNGHLYRSQTSVANFPDGMSEPVIAMQDSNKYALWEASNVYKIEGTDRYLLIIEAIGSNGRYFRSWTSTSLAGPWTALAAAENQPFAGPANVSFPGGKWTQDISHGELIRNGVDQRLEVDLCDMQYLYQGRDPNSGGDYNNLPWRLGLLTQTNSSPDCGGTGEEPTTTPPPTSTPPPSGACTATVTVVGDWGSGWQGRVDVKAGSAALTGWTLTWTWPGSQKITSAWNAEWSQSGAAVTAGDVGWNGSVAAGQSREAFGFVASGPSTAPQVTCQG